MWSEAGKSLHASSMFVRREGVRKSVKEVEKDKMEESR